MGMAVLQNTVISIRTLKPINVSPLLNYPAVTQAEHAGQPYYQIQPPGPPQMKFAFFLAGPQAAVVGSEPLIQGLLERGPNTAPPTRLQNVVDDRHQLVFIGAPKGGMSSVQGASPLPLGPGTPGLPPQLQQLMEMQDSMLVTSFGITLDENINVLLQYIMSDPAAAEQVGGLAQQFTDQGKQFMAQPNTEVPPDVAQLLQDVMNSVQVSQSQQRVFISATISGSGLQTLIAKAVAEAGSGGVTGTSPGTSPGATTPAVTVAGPEGLSLSADLKWSDTVMLDQNNKELPQPLVVEVTITGDAAAAAHSYGMLKIDTVTGPQGQSLEQEEDRFSFNDISESYESIERSEDEFFSEHPKDGVRLEIQLKHPEPPISEIAQLKGSVRIRSGGDQATVPNVLSQQGQTLSTPELKKANLEVSIGESTDPQSISISCKGPLDSIVSLTLVDATGTPLDPSGYGSSGFGDTMSYDYSYDQPIPANASLRISLATNATVTEVPFEFQNLKVPPPSPAAGVFDPTGGR